MRLPLDENLSNRIAAWLTEGPAGFKLGGRVRYRRSDLEAWLQRHADDWG
jgi:hypothetical protein